MTLCLAWSRQGQISFASDSRLSNGNVVVTDMATKIFTINVQAKRRTTHELLLSMKYGLCFTGSYLNGSLLADTMGEFLSSLTAEEAVQFSADTIVEIALGIYEDVSRHQMQLNGRAGLCEVWLAGHCPASTRNRLFKLSWEYAGEGIRFFSAELTFEQPILFLGDQDARDYAAAHAVNVDYTNGYTEYHLLQDVINNPAMPTVGGAIQTGHLLRNSFSAFGMIDYELQNLPGCDLVHVAQVATFRAIPLDRAQRTVNQVRLSTSKISMAPFREKEQALTREMRRLNGLEQ